MKDISEVYAGKFRCLYNVLDCWVEINSNLAKCWHSSKDVPWWYGERAQLSLFSGAVWQAGGYVFEEFSVDKSHMTKDNRPHRKKQPYRGRLDMHFAIGPHEFMVEAKQVFSGVSIDADVKCCIENGLKRAYSDVRRGKQYRNVKLAATFVCPRIGLTKKECVDERLEYWMDCARSVDCTAYAWTFPNVARYTEGYRHYYPGTAIFLKTHGRTHF